MTTQHLLRRFCALAATYALAEITGLNGMLKIIMERDYWQYQALFYPVLFGLSFAAFSFVGMRRMRSLVWGALCGYAAGLAATLVLPFLIRWNAHDAFGIAREMGTDVFLVPLVTLGWLMGICFAFCMAVQEIFAEVNRKHLAAN